MKPYIDRKSAIPGEMTATTRRYDIDWLRVIAIGLLILYHIGIAFQPWGVFIGFIQSDKPLDSLWVPMSMLTTWPGSIWRSVGG